MKDYTGADIENEIGSQYSKGELRTADMLEEFRHENKQLRKALEEIAARGCMNVVGGCESVGFDDDGMCSACTARAALGTSEDAETPPMGLAEALSKLPILGGRKPQAHATKPACETCGGSGYVPCPSCATIPPWESCHDCHGAGCFPCPVCGGE